MIIGICGKSGSGKSTLARRIRDISERDCVHLDMDKIGHMVLTLPDVKNELVKVFGESVVSDGNADRKKLGEIVFNSREKMSDLLLVYLEVETE